MGRGSRWSLGVRLTGFLAAVGALAAAAFHNALGTILANVFQWIGQNVLSSLVMDPWPWSVTFVAVLVCLATVYYFRHHYRVQSRALKTLHNIGDLDDSLLRLLANWNPSKDHETEVKRILADLLHDAMKEFDDEVHRAALFLPDATKENLMIWTHYGMPETTVRDRKFYIGNDRTRWQDQGVAGQAYLEMELRHGRMTKENGIWRSSCDGYKKFGTHAPPYRSFIAVPIPSAESQSTPSGKLLPVCQGVVCFDSTNPTIFNSEESQNVLRIFARRIAAVLIICEQLPSPPPPTV